MWRKNSSLKKKTLSFGCVMKILGNHKDYPTPRVERFTFISFHVILVTLKRVTCSLSEQVGTNKMRALYELIIFPYSLYFTDDISKYNE